MAAARHLRTPPLLPRCGATGVSACLLTRRRERTAPDISTAAGEISFCLFFALGGTLCLLDHGGWRT
jgi:hypothetical protein